jgi:hypothetical protein
MGPAAHHPTAERDQRIPGLQLADAGQHRTGSGRPEEREHLVQCHHIDVARQFAIAEKRLDLRGEQQSARRFGEVQRLDAQVIARDEQRAPLDARRAACLTSVAVRNTWPAVTSSARSVR